MAHRQMNDNAAEARPERPLVSVIVPTCDRRDILGRCLQALARQTYPDYEVVVVDDFSADGTPDLLREFAEGHPELALRALRNEVHAGANPSRNRGIRVSKGAFIAFLDSDCIAEPGWIENLVRGFTSDRVAAVTGLVLDTRPRNIYELAFKGTHRQYGTGPARRLVGCNMCIRRGPLLKCGVDEDRAEPDRSAGGRPDVTVSGRGDEEGLFLVLRAAGYEQRAVGDAVVLHEHGLNRRSFFRQAYRGGRSAARLVYKYHLPHRLDLLPFMCTYLTLLLFAVQPWLAAVPAFFFAAALAAITYNDLVRKGKTLAETIRSFPVLLLYYHLRLAGYVLETLRLRLGKGGLERVRLEQIPQAFSDPDSA